MFSSSGDVVCTLMIEILDIFNERLGWGGGGREEGTLICRGGASSTSREGRFLTYLSNRT